MALYNPAAIAFGYFKATFHWLDSGVIEMKAEFAVSIYCLV